MRVLSVQWRGYGMCVRGGLQTRGTAPLMGRKSEDEGTDRGVVMELGCWVISDGPSG